ncbi:hypothetical protein CEXT_351151 [Caerostris extrusa]|uniref:Uncharacterized protein n=1 Tax=Caerostris extrusa TaxID=172846 RepID=A0AAV4UPU2_CAEEX|nr:hypothetical protein CEXT_351151 [Caerostris extrusa]
MTKSTQVISVEHRKTPPGTSEDKNENQEIKLPIEEATTKPDEWPAVPVQLKTASQKRTATSHADRNY